jgi:hypothetical protein
MHHADRRPLRRGFVRVQVAVHKNDAWLLRAAAKALGDPRREHEIRALLRSRFGKKSKGLKEYLACAPLEGIDLSRTRDFGRDFPD